MSHSTRKACRQPNMVKQIWTSRNGGLLIFMVGMSLAALEPAYQSAAEKELMVEDQMLDAQIQKTIVEIEELHALRNISNLHLSPQQTNVKLKENGSCIEVSAHSQDHEFLRAKSAPIDYKMQNIQLCYSKDKLTRIKSAFTTISRLKREKTENTFTHESPSSTSANDIILTGAFNEIASGKLRVGDLQNSTSKPIRVSFKKDYYLPHLKDTAYILQRTFDMHRHEAIQTNTKTVNKYLDYAK
jgi:hypothetical protein